MDANGQRFWLLADARHWPQRQDAVWDSACRVLRLASRRTLPPQLTAAEAFARAQAALEQVPRAIDAVGSVASWDAAAGAVLAQSPALAGAAVRLALDAAPTDLCAAPDGVLYAAVEGRIHLHDLRGRFDDLRIGLPGFTAWRLAPADDGGVWALERSSGRLARLRGRPLRRQTPPPDAYAADVFRPAPENGAAPALTLVAEAPWPGADPERAIALAAGPDGALLLLSWRGGDGQPCLRCWQPELWRWGRAWLPAGAAYAWAAAWLQPDRIALRVPGCPDAPAFDLPAPAPAAGTDPQLAPAGEIYPIAADSPEAPFANGTALPPHYPVDDVEAADGAAPASVRHGAEPLHALSLVQLARHGRASGHATDAIGRPLRLIDSGSDTTVWHRLCAEAALPPRTGLIVWLAATQEPVAPDDDAAAQWHPHLFGRDVALAASTSPNTSPALRRPHRPQAVWERAASELPGHPGLLGGERRRDERGLYSVLIQQSLQRVRRLSGRYLWVRVELFGDGRRTPELAALRAWGSRFAYAEHYLPRLYRESVFGADAALPGERLGTLPALPGLTTTAALATTLDQSLLPDALSAGPDWPVLGADADVSVETPGRLWLLRDGTAAWWLRLEGEPGEADQIGLYRPQATPADFTERLLAGFESVLTPIEDRIAAAHLLTDPAVAADAQLDWLAGWIGVAFDAALPAARRRDWLRAAPLLAERHGTAAGLRLALDIASGGGVRGGEIVLVENFRLRRLMATILGADLGDAEDPLLPGLHVNTSSVVGDTLILGAQERAELLALFDVGSSTAAEEAAVLDFDAQLAHRALVLVHREIEAQDLGLIRRIVRLEAPAHVEVQVAPARWPLLVGVASLVGVDTYLGPPRTVRPVRVQQSVLGLGDRLVGAPLLDPRLGGATPAALPPQAEAGEERVVASIGTLLLDASGSTAAPGRRITEYRWHWLLPDEPGSPGSLTPPDP